MSRLQCAAIKMTDLKAHATIRHQLACLSAESGRGERHLGSW
jgi:hypothetical protein